MVESREPLSATEKRKQSVALRAESDAQPREALKSLLSLWPSVVLAFLLCVKKYFLYADRVRPPHYPKRAGQPVRSKLRMPSAWPVEHVAKADPIPRDSIIASIPARCLKMTGVPDRRSG
jgi:hypothetical protein